MKMFVDPPAIYLHRDPVDFRKAVNGLALIVEQQMELSPFSEALFIFCNKAGDKVKVLYWDKTGFCLWYKRLEKERFKWPHKYVQPVMKLSEDKWQSLLSGYNILGHEPLFFLPVQADLRGLMLIFLAVFCYNNSHENGIKT